MNGEKIYSVKWRYSFKNKNAIQYIAQQEKYDFSLLALMHTWHIMYPLTMCSGTTKDEMDKQHKKSFFFMSIVYRRKKTYFPYICKHKLIPRYIV